MGALLGYAQACRQDTGGAPAALPVETGVLESHPLPVVPSGELPKEANGQVKKKRVVALIGDGSFQVRACMGDCGRVLERPWLAARGASQVA